MRELASPSRSAAVRAPPGLGAVASGLLLWASAVSACGAEAPAAPPDVDIAAPYDPFSPFNRQVHGFNMAFDRAAFGPATRAYTAVVPRPMRQGIGAALDNLKEPRITLNDLAQGHVRRAARSTSRFVLNSTLGLLGFFDVATKLGLPYHSADFGQTLGRYGLEPGPYLVVPILGPANVRDGLGRVVDAFIDPVNILLIGGLTSTGGATRFVAQGLDDRADLDPQMQALDDATDPYATMRSAYMQRRAALVRDATGEAEVLPEFETEPRPDDIAGRPPSLPARAPGASGLAAPAGDPAGGGGRAGLSEGP